MQNTNLTKNANKLIQKGATSSTLLVKPNEVLVKIEEGAIVVRNTEGKLVRRKSQTGKLDPIYNIIKLGETFIKIEGDAVIIRNTDGKLVKRKFKQASRSKVKPETKPDSSQQKVSVITPDEDKKKSIGAINPALKVVRINKDEIKKESENFEPLKETTTNPPEQKIEETSLRDRLKNKHAFLSRLERGESISAPKPSVSAPGNDTVFKAATVEIEDLEEIEDIEQDASVTMLEEAVTGDRHNRNVGNMSSVAVRGAGRGHVSGSAVNPNKKPELGSGSKMSQSLAGNDMGAYEIAQPESNVLQKVQKVKKQRKPFNSKLFVLSLVAIYAIGMISYFMVGYNFKPKKVDLVLYYIDIGQNAKLKYYDGEKINTTDMLMTFYYDENKVQNASLTESNIADPTEGMGYDITSQGYVNALWTGNYSSSEYRDIKLKFDYDGLICYVPVTIYRNKLKELIKQFDVPTLSAGQEINPTIYAKYTNAVIEANGENKQRELSHDSYDLILYYNGEYINLKEEGFYENGTYVMPENHKSNPIDYSISSLKLIARYNSDGFNAQKDLELYKNN